jgi:ABC-type phosphate/phosphonate transport system substrate-binding protein
MTAFAALGMYDLPAMRTATDAWWQGLAAALRRAGLADVPERLIRDAFDWDSPDLLLAQTCGYPFTTSLAGLVQLVATPCYAAPGCAGPDYCSLLVVRADEPAGRLADLRGRTAAINGPDSLSGYVQLRALAAPLAEQGRFFAALRRTGSHAQSIAAVRTGAADVAAIDAVTHALLARHAPEQIEGTRVLQRTPQAPGLPYVTSRQTSPAVLAALRAGLADMLAEPALAPARADLLLTGAEILPAAAYDRVGALAAQGAGLLDPVI